MHLIPTIYQVASFEGDAIAQVWLDPYGVRFLFESMDQLYAEHGIEHVEPDGKIWRYNCEATKGPSLVLHRLLYKRINADERSDLRLTFRFEDGSALTVLSELGPYECGHIISKKGGYWVF